MAYVVAAWVIVEVSSLILEIYETPDSVLRIIVALLALGLPFAMFFAWAFEVTPEGIKRESQIDRSRLNTHQTARRLDILTIALVVVAIGLFAADRLMPNLFDEAAVNSSATTDSDRDLAWATQQLLEINRLGDLGENRAAFNLAAELEPFLTDDADSENIWDGISWSSDIDTMPTGARVYRQSIEAPDDEWEDLGISPLRTVRFVDGEGYRLRFELPGHRTVELLHIAIGEFPFSWLDRMIPVRLDPEGDLPEEMVRIPGFTRDLVDYDDFFMDRFEVTNGDYEKFVSSGGHKTRDYWRNTFESDGVELPWEEAMAQFTDRTGRPGPSTWTGGVYPVGQRDYPVSGVSWYEAAAYAAFVQKTLPTTGHLRTRHYYNQTAGMIASRSNLGTDGPWPVGENRAMNAYGVYDLDGNVREWVWNDVGDGTKGTAGAAWTDAPFHVTLLIPKSPWDRDTTQGIRLIRTFDSVDKLAKLREPEAKVTRRDFSKEQPATDSEVAIYKSMYAYDPLPLNAEIVEDVAFEHWHRQRVEFDLPYEERGAAYLYIPNNTDPPYETVVYWPGWGATFFQSVDEEYLPAFDFIVRSGRVLAAPILKGQFDRDDEDFSITGDSIWGSERRSSIQFRDFQIKWVQDFSRTVDYLETRPEFNLHPLGYYGFSWGSAIAPIVLSVDDRFGAAVLNVGGLYDVALFQPAGDAVNFVTRVRNPALMINGQYDPIFPLETSQKPMFELLGTDPAHKKMYVTPGDHSIPRDVLIRETLDWFDRYLDDEGN